MSDDHDEGVSRQAAVAAGVQLEMADRRFKSGVGWFFWIGGLSVVNSVVFLNRGGWAFVVGLGVTRFVDEFALAMAHSVGGKEATWIKAGAFGLDIVLAGIFAVFGALARKRYGWAIITGMVLYALDALIFIFVYVHEWLSVAFHGLALFGLYSGLKALSQLTALERAMQASEGLSSAPPTGGDGAP